MHNIHDENMKRRKKKRIESPISHVSDVDVLRRSRVWSEDCQPQTTSELVIDKKKVALVKKWMLSALDSNGKECRWLMLRGPPGCGRKTLIRVLSHDLNVSILALPVPPPPAPLFRLFLHNSTQTDPSSRRIVLLDDPNFENEVLENATREDISRKHGHPVVLLRSTQNTTFNNITELSQVLSVTLNPVAPTFTRKALKRIVDRCRRMSEQPSVSIEEAISISEGDLSRAINYLQFGGGNVVEKEKKGKRFVGGDVLHAVGKVLYATDSKPEKLPELCSCTPALLTAFLHRNFLRLFGQKSNNASLDDETKELKFSSKVLDDISLSDLYFNISFGPYAENYDSIGSFISLRGYKIHATSDESPSSVHTHRWMPLYSPWNYTSHVLSMQLKRRMYKWLRDSDVRWTSLVGVSSEIWPFLALQLRAGSNPWSPDACFAISESSGFSRMRYVDNAPASKRFYNVEEDLNEDDMFGGDHVVGRSSFHPSGPLPDDDIEEV